MNMKPLSLFFLAFSCFGLIACGNGRKDVNTLDLVKPLISRAPAPGVDDPAQVGRAINQALESIDGPLALATFEKPRNNVVLRPIETNGAYRTWTSWGYSERRSVTTKNGVITATRGLREDLMSTDVDASLSLISSRQSGTATRVQRYLNGENQIVAIRASCSIERGETVQVQAGEIDRAAIQMTENCEAEGRTFKNTYLVDSNGRVVQSVQWLNDFYGRTVVQALR